TRGVLREIPTLARAHGLRVTLGLWLSEDRSLNEAELDGLRYILQRDHSIERILVGNETIAQSHLEVDELVGYLRRVKALTKIPLSTAEIEPVWKGHPELAREVDYIGVHIHPFWRGLSVEAALENTFERMAELRLAYPDQPLILAETGWPSHGRSI